MSYVDGFVVAVPKKNLAKYESFARAARDVWLEHGALEYREWIEDDVKPGKVTSFPQAVKREDGEVVIIAWIVYESREHRDRVNEKAMADPRMQGETPETRPFDGMRMIHGGFKALL